MNERGSEGTRMRRECGGDDAKKAREGKGAQTGHTVRRFERIQIDLSPL